MGIEDPPDDVAEQSRPVVEDSEDDELDLSGQSAETPWEANPADVAEQRLEIYFEDPDADLG
ncbi:MAG: hypothetical protein QOD82_1915 [Pseudonocardiales bacterium]|jgi:hypothetical protein|nr:hypothetical protein [Pseudonocardiales bacterium]MDT7674013.1 hypothetical protein [Pseudonocardiales bacterium]